MGLRFSWTLDGIGILVEAVVNLVELRQLLLGRSALVNV